MGELPKGGMKQGGKAARIECLCCQANLRVMKTLVTTASADDPSAVQRSHTAGATIARFQEGFFYSLNA